MNEKLTIPQPAEWDFQPLLQDGYLEEATAYEYARSSGPLAADIDGWLSQKIQRLSVRQHILQKLKTGKRYAPRVYGQIRDTGVVATRNLSLFDVIMRLRPDFPKPWNTFKLRWKENPRFRGRIQCDHPSTLVRAIKDYISDNQTVEAGLSHAEKVFNSDFVLSIDWHQSTVEDLLQDFEIWIRKEAKKHPEMKPSGKNGQLQIEPLKWLAAHRLRSAGMTFSQAQAMLAHYVDPSTANRNHAREMGLIGDLPTAINQASHGKRQVLPIYADKSRWSTALSKCARKIAQAEQVDPKAVAFYPALFKG